MLCIPQLHIQFRPPTNRLTNLNRIYTHTHTDKSYKYDLVLIIINKRPNNDDDGDDDSTTNIKHIKKREKDKTK